MQLWGKVSANGEISGALTQSKMIRRTDAEWALDRFGAVRDLCSGSIELPCVVLGHLRRLSRIYCLWSCHKCAIRVRGAEVQKEEADHGGKGMRYSNFLEGNIRFA